MKMLLGVNKDKELVFGEFGIHDNYFSASFDTVRPFRDENIDLGDYFEGFLDGLDKEYKYDLCCQYSCAPDDLCDCMADACEDVRDTIDCSIYPKKIAIEDYEENIDEDVYNKAYEDGVTEANWYFESMAGGQHDTKGTMQVYVNPEIYKLLYRLWSNYHLKDMDTLTEYQRQDILSGYHKLRESQIDEELWIAAYLANHYEDYNK